MANIYPEDCIYKVAMCPKCGYVKMACKGDDQKTCKVCRSAKLIYTDYDWNTYTNTETDFDVYEQHCKVRELYFPKNAEPKYIALREEFELIYRTQYILKNRPEYRDPDRLIFSNIPVAPGTVNPSYKPIPKSAMQSSRSPVSVECPYCHGTNTTKISTSSVMLDHFLWGLFGSKRHKQWHCNDCGSDF